MPEVERARCRTNPIASPTTSPSTAPRTVIVTDSHRIIRRTCRRVAPTARTRPISRVRSATDSASVLTTPRTAITIDSASRA